VFCQNGGLLMCTDLGLRWPQGQVFFPMRATKDQATKLVQRAVKVLQRHAPPNGLTDAQAMDELYGILDTPAVAKLVQEMPKKHRV
jgi:hypothetical protein